jgi:hypothetical protein
MPRQRIANLLLLSFLTVLLIFPQLSTSYPLISVIDEGQERCFRFNVPLQDEAHLMAVVLPSEDELPHDTVLETWYVDQLHKLAKSKAAHHNILPLHLSDEIPKDVSDKQHRYLEDRHGTLPSIKFKFTNLPTDDKPVFNHEVEASYFKPAVVNHVVRILSGKAESEFTSQDREDASLQGYGVCIHNPDAHFPVHVVFDIVLASEDLSQFDVPVKEKKPTTDFDKTRHLTPLEQSVDLSIRAARSVVREMNYMEKREARMRLTADSINSRVRWFSYLSVGVLLLVTYLQVTYLKRYFHKKKLM